MLPELCSFNIEEEKWDPELLDLFDVPPNILPEVCENVSDFGSTKILGGQVNIGGVAGDQQAALIGQCCFNPGEVKSTYGTGCFMIVNTGEEAIYSKIDFLQQLATKSMERPRYALKAVYLLQDLPFNG